MFDRIGRKGHLIILYLFLIDKLKRKKNHSAILFKSYNDVSFVFSGIAIGSLIGLILVVLLIAIVLIIIRVSK